MRPPSVRILASTLLLALLAACGSRPAGPAPSGTAEAPRRSGPTRVTATIMDDPVFMLAKLSAPSIRGADALEELVHVGLSTLDHSGSLTPLLGEAVPSIDNGLWTVHPDGTMDTTYRIREGARWQDGSPFTSDDLLFTARVAHDRDVPDLRDPAFDSISDPEAIDARTLVV